MTRVHRKYIAAGILISFAVIARQALADASVYGEVTVATDYVFRGVSQTLSAPALQAELGFEHDNGWYGFVWGSNVDFTDDLPGDGAHSEINLSIGREFELGERISVGVAGVSYLFPNTNPGFDYDYVEWLVKVVLDDRHTFRIGHSGDVFGSGDPAQYYALQTHLDIARRLTLGVQLGYYDLDHAYGASYGFVELELAGGGQRLGWRISYVATNDRAAELFPDDTVHQRVVFALRLSF